MKFLYYKSVFYLNLKSIIFLRFIKTYTKIKKLKCLAKHSMMQWKESQHVTKPSKEPTLESPDHSLENCRRNIFCRSTCNWQLTRLWIDSYISVLHFDLFHFAFISIFMHKNCTGWVVLKFNEIIHVYRVRKSYYFPVKNFPQNKNSPKTNIWKIFDTNILTINLMFLLLENYNNKLNITKQ